MTHIDYKEATKHSYLNYDEVKNSIYAGCYHCKRVFLANIIDKDKHCIASRHDGTQEPTVFCPICGVDAVVGDASGYPVTYKTFLELMNSYNFQTDT